MTDFATLIAAHTGGMIEQVSEGALPWLLAEAARGNTATSRTVFIARDSAMAAQLATTVPVFDPGLGLKIVPGWDCLPYDRASPSARLSADRLAALVALAHPPVAENGPELVIIPVAATLQRVLARDVVRPLARRITVGDTLPRETLVAQLLLAGYSRVDTVIEPGDFAIRGGLIDICAPGDADGVRLDFFGDMVEQIRRFSVADQRSTGLLTAFTLLPMSEVLLDEGRVRRFRQAYIDRFGVASGKEPLYQAVSAQRRWMGMEHWLPLFEERLETLFDYLMPGDQILVDAQAQSAVQQRLETITDHYDSRKAALKPDATRPTPTAAAPPLPPEALYLTHAQWQEDLSTAKAYSLTPHTLPPQSGALNARTSAARNFAPERQDHPAAIYAALKEHVSRLHAQGARVVIAALSAGSAGHLADLFADHDLPHAGVHADWPSALGAAANAPALLVLPITHGFGRGPVAVLSEQDILGDRLARQKRQRKAPAAFFTEMAGLTPGDLVVHRDHGVGRYTGLVAIPVGGAPHDCVGLDYADSAKLFVPVENLDVLSRYGGDHDGAVLDKLGGVAWQNRRARLKDRIREIAHELLALAAARALKEAPEILPEAAPFEEFCARFPFVETEDQDQAIADILGDLAAGRPMDRLVCGDVGFGKTEVALRAAFVAAASGLQVAVICPTTLLARQHLATFQARFDGFPLTVAGLSRLTASAEAVRVREAAANGTLDILVGTHALLAKSLSFQRLGLVIVDEEQHFGVTHKERLKQMRKDVHVLTLTATPIPRTLHMALSGLRDLSVIATPPVDRLAIRTYITPWDAQTVREAILREHYRGGQSFIVAPRIADLTEIAALLADHVPEVRAVVAHGQMSPGEIEARMTAFVDGAHDVLIATSIIESGLDIPRANTLIAYRADMFGLSQLYQLRGRVGRAKTRAYAYLTTDPQRPPTATAAQRLHILSTLEELGAGFQLASHDLDIRGAGNLLGDEQSGHIREVGFELYQQMLEEAMLSARAGVGAETLHDLPDATLSPQIALGVSVLLPEAYIPDLGVRMGLYRRIGDLTSREEIASVTAELIDRFGPLPPEARNLLKIIEIKSHCRKAGIARLDAGPRGVLIGFHNDYFANPAGLVAFLSNPDAKAKLRPDQKLIIAKAWREDVQRVNAVLALAKTLAALAAATQAEAAGKSAIKAATSSAGKGAAHR